MLAKIARDVKTCILLANVILIRWNTAFSFIIKPSLRPSLSLPSSINDDIAPIVSTERKQYVKNIIDRVYGVQDSGTWNERRDDARSTTNILLNSGNDYDDRSCASKNSMLQNIPEHELVYGELGIDALITILDAIGVRKGDTFLDIGSGDGLLVCSAALLFPEYIQSSNGIEIVPQLYQRSLKFKNRLMDILLEENIKDEAKIENEGNKRRQIPDMPFYLGNIYDESDVIVMSPSDDNTTSNCIPREEMFSKTTIAICFATTWSKNIPGKKLHRLSKALVGGANNNGISNLPKGAKIVIIDGCLSPNDGYIYEGELKLYCPDTAPYSIARLYTRT